MAKFEDHEGDKWNLRMNYYDVKEIQERTGISFMVGEDEDTTPGQDIVQDPEKLMTAVYLAVRDQAEERDMTEDEVKKRFSYGPFMPLINAWTEAIQIFLGTDMGEGEEGPLETENQEDG